MRNVPKHRERLQIQYVKLVEESAQIRQLVLRGSPYVPLTEFPSQCTDSAPKLPEAPVAPRTT